MSKKVAKAVVAVARGTKIKPAELSGLILTAHASGTTAKELQKAAANAKRKNEK